MIDNFSDNFQDFNNFSDNFAYDFRANFHKISTENHKFWRKLSDIDSPAREIFIHGNISEDFANFPVVGIVGARKCTAYGRAVCLDISRKLSRDGIVIVSGLALGIDGLAARGALDALKDFSRVSAEADLKENFAKKFDNLKRDSSTAKSDKSDFSALNDKIFSDENRENQSAKISPHGKSIAVLGTPIDQIYPRQNQDLAREILQNGGAIISEIAPNAKFYPKSSFLARNRLISALSDVLIVVEAGEQSGTLNTAAHALAQNRELMAVPGNITSPLSIGCNKLIAQGAAPVLDENSVLEKLCEIWQNRAKIDKKSRKTYENLRETLNKNLGKSGARNQTKINLRKSEISAGDDAKTRILKLLARGLTDGDEILRAANLSAGEFSVALTMLEISGEIRALGANKFGLR